MWTISVAYLTNLLDILNKTYIRSFQFMYYIEHIILYVNLIIDLEKLIM